VNGLDFIEDKLGELRKAVLFNQFERHNPKGFANALRGRD
jgi:hypothetical protein